MADLTQRDQVFISYSHNDKRLFDQLQTSLKPLVRGKKISVWDDTKIKSGDAWREQIKAAIASAKVAVLLVSPDYLASDFIAEHELPPLLEAAQKEGLRILWIAARFSMYEETEIARYQAVNDPAKPLAGMSGANREKELVRICKEIKSAALETTTEHRQPSTHTIGDQGTPGTSGEQLTSEREAGIRYLHDNLAGTMWVYRWRDTDFEFGFGRSGDLHTLQSWKGVRWRAIGPTTVIFDAPNGTQMFLQLDETLRTFTTRDWDGQAATGRRTNKRLV